MFGDFFGGDDFVEQVIEEEMILDMLECGQCRGTCSCGYYNRPVQPVRMACGRCYGTCNCRHVQQQRLLGCGRCYGSCGCSGYDELGNLLAAEMAVEIVEDIVDGFGDFF